MSKSHVVSCVPRISTQAIFTGESKQRVQEKTYITEYNKAATFRRVKTLLAKT